MSKREILRRLLFLAFAIALVAPIFDQPFAYPRGYDFRHFIAWIEAGRRSLLWYGDFPLWNPGPAVARSISPIRNRPLRPRPFWALLFGTALGTKLMLVSYLFFAQDGMYRLARRPRPALDADAAMLAAIVFGGSGWFGLHLSSGHLNFAGAALFPYLLLCHRRGRSRPWGVVDPARCADGLDRRAGWNFDGGDGHHAALTVSAHRDPAAPQPAPAVGAVARCALLPADWGRAPVTSVRVRPRPSAAHVRDRSQPRALPAAQRAALARACRPSRASATGSTSTAGSCPMSRRRCFCEPAVAAIELAALAAVRFWPSPSQGAAWPYGPWWLMKHLPLFKDLRVPSRACAAFCALAAAPLIGVTAQRLLAGRSFASPRCGRWVIYCCRRCHRLQRLALPRHLRPRHDDQSRPFTKVQGHWQQMLSEILLNHGVIGCDEESPLQRAASLDLGDVPQARMADPRRAAS